MSVSQAFNHAMKFKKTAFKPFHLHFSFDNFVFVLSRTATTTKLSDKILSNLHWVWVLATSIYYDIYLTKKVIIL